MQQFTTDHIAEDTAVLDLGCGPGCFFRLRRLGESMERGREGKFRIDSHVLRKGSEMK